jgi:hypothetical protein
MQVEEGCEYDYKAGYEDCCEAGCDTNELTNFTNDAQNIRCPRC